MAINKKLDQKIKELKLQAKHLNKNYVSLDTRGKRTDDVASNLEKGILSGYAVVWGQKNLANQKCIKGSCAKSLAERGPKSSAKYKITCLWQHRQDDPLGMFEILEEDDYGLYFKTFPLDDVTSAKRALKQIKSGTINQLSVGFDYVWDRIEYDEADDCVVLLEINLFEISIVTIGMDQETFIHRSAETISTLHDDVEDFIETLPRVNRLPARQLFARHKSLIDLTEFKPEEDVPPVEQVRKKINYKSLLKQM